MSELILWKNQEMNKLRKDIDRLFNRVWSGFGITSLSDFPGAPSIQFSEDEHMIVVKAKLPGMDPKDLSISATENTLTIRGRKKEEAVDTQSTYHIVERKFGSYSRTFRLPCKVRIDDVEANYKNGVLFISLPKCDPEKPRGVRIRVE